MFRICWIRGTRIDGDRIRLFCGAQHSGPWPLFPTCGAFPLVMNTPLLLVLSVALAAPLSATPLQGTPWVTDQEQEPDRGVSFPLPQHVDHTTGRRIKAGMSNGLTVSWDGRLLLYVDGGDHVATASHDDDVWVNHPSGTLDEGYVFTTFDKSRVLNNGGEPDFGKCFGDQPLPRFASILRSEPPDIGVNYPEQALGYPPIPNSMGELGLLMADYLTSNLYPADTSAPSNQNPYPGFADGSYDPFGAYRIYDAWVLMQDITKFWIPDLATTDPDDGKWGRHSSLGEYDYYHEYEPLVDYPNGVEGATNIKMKRNGLCKLRIFVMKGTGGGKDEVTSVEILRKWEPFSVSGDDQSDFITVSAPAPTVGISIPSDNTMYADNFEPNLSFDGHLMVGKGSTLLCANDLPMRVCFYYNPVAFATDGWRGPFELTELYSLNTKVLGGITIADRYPIARHPVKDYDGAELAATDAFEGGYTWFSPDGRYVIYTTYTGGVGREHPQTTLAADGGGSSNRAHVSIFGSVTGWQMWRIDSAAINPTRHMFTGWDQDSRTAHQRVASFGFSPGFWDMLRGAANVPKRDDGATKLHLVVNQQLQYFEFDLSPYQERDYGFYLPMSVMLTLLDPGGGNQREIDLTRTPDLSGNGHYGVVVGGELPCEYFDLPSNTNKTEGQSAPGALLGLYLGATNPDDIHAGWTTADTVSDITGTKYWARLADWKDGRDTTGDGIPDTAPFAGRGEKRDMDSDYSWGRVGQAMFFKDRTYLTVANGGHATPELNPGSSAYDPVRELHATDQLTASLWVRPLQARTGVATLLRHNIMIALQADGSVTGTVIDNSQLAWSISSAPGAAPDLDWTHIALTWRATTSGHSEARLFVNGVEVVADRVLPFAELQLSTLPVFVGNLEINAAEDSQAAVLLLDEVALKNSALISKDVASLALLPVSSDTWTPQGFDAGPKPFVAEDERVPTTDVGFVDLNYVAKIGADLFRDVQLSSNKEISCATCHVPENGFVDQRNLAVGITGELKRNTPTIYNARYSAHQLWDSRAVDLEDQALDPVFSPDEMGFTEWSDVGRYFANDEGYQQRFGAWQGSSIPTITDSDVRVALATYIRTLTAGNAPADHATLSQSEERGKQLFFGQARCSGCHNGPSFSDGRLWTTGTFRSDHHDDGAFNDNLDLEAAGTSQRQRFLGAFKTPTLRELKRTGPYFHDGTAATLTDVVEFYNRGGVRSDAGKAGGGFDLLEGGHDIVAEQTNYKLDLDSQTDVPDLVAYLAALTAGPSGSVNDGPAGWNNKPVVTPRYPGAGYLPPVTPSKRPPSVVFQVKDSVDGRTDFQTSMDWTLEVDVLGTVYNWSDGTVTDVADGHEVSLWIPGGLQVGSKVRVADHHGLWSDWLTLF